jgi:NADH-quinone oxidoreductase subunit E
VNGFRILIVDRATKQRAGYEEALEQEGYLVETAEDEDDGLSKVREGSYDLVLTEMDIGGVEGFKLLRLMSNLDPEMTTMVVTAHPTVEGAVESLKRGAFHYLSKTTPPEKLVEHVHHALEKKRLRQRAELLRIEKRIRAVSELEGLGRVDQVMDRLGYEPSALIAVLQDVQKELRYLPRDALRLVAARLNLPLTRVYGIATFYKAFSLKPRGRHLISVCLGTACHVRGGVKILEALERGLGVQVGGTTTDERFSLETVRCVGCCGLAPVAVIDEDFHGKLTQERIPQVLSQYS